MNDFYIIRFVEDSISIIGNDNKINGRIMFTGMYKVRKIPGVRAVPTGKDGDRKRSIGLHSLENDLIEEVQNYWKYFAFKKQICGIRICFSGHKQFINQAVFVNKNIGWKRLFRLSS